MLNPTDIVDLTPEEIEESWNMFNACENSHLWEDEPETSIFYRRCSRCGGAEGIRFPEGIL